MSDLLRDVRFAARRLFATPLFTVATVLTLALGIGANTAMFTIVNGVLLKPLPFPEPDRLIGLWQTAPGVDIVDLNASVADYITYREESRTLADVAIWGTNTATVSGQAEPERVDGMVASFRLLRLVGVQPMLGRDFAEKDNDTSSPEVVMLGYGYWQRRFGGDPSAVGRRLTVDGTAREIIGVLPRGFWHMDTPHDLVFPLRFDRAKVRLAGYNWRAVGRLRPGVTLEQANADVARMIRVAFGKFPPPQGMNLQMMEDARLGPNVRPLMDDLVGDFGRTLWVVMATIGIVLLIACANVANLLLVRTEGRAQELAVRTALGAGQGRIAREILVESLLLGALGGAVGVGVAVTVLKGVLTLSPARLPRFDLIGVDATSLVFTAVISLAAGLAFGAIPVVKHARVRLTEALRAGGRTASASRQRNVTRNTLTVVQVALALVLLIGSGLMIRTFQSMRRVQPGFTEPASLQTLRLSISREVAADDARVLLVQQELVARLAALPGASTAGLINGLPMTGFSSQDPVFAADRDHATGEIPPLRRYLRVGPGVFRTLGTPIVAGRDYDWADLHARRDVALISENFAREYWGSAGAAIGKRLRGNPNDPWSEIIGVVADIRHDGADQPAPSTVYWPLRGTRSVSVAVRGPRAGTEAYATEIRQAVAAVGRGLPITQLQTMTEVYDRSMSRTAFTLTLLATSGGMALLLAAVGIYAVISYTVSQRVRDIGIRLALGAAPASVKLMIVRSGLLWGGIGAAAGLVAAALLSRLMSALLFGVDPIDPLTYAAVAAALLAATAVASYLPARRVTRINPIDALRAE
jgi:putative ABC transport system permease protein